MLPKTARNQRRYSVSWANGLGATPFRLAREYYEVCAISRECDKDTDVLRSLDSEPLETRPPNTESPTHLAAALPFRNESSHAASTFETLAPAFDD
jgi:hypothetical protein